MGTRTFLVILEFSENVESYEETVEVMHNLLEAIYDQANNQLAPANTNIYTTKITIEYPLYSLETSKEL